MSEAVNDAKIFSRNAKGVRELLSMKFDTFPFEGEWYDAFDMPERKGVWMIWGNTGNGKTSRDATLQGIVQVWTCGLR